MRRDAGFRSIYVVMVHGTPRKSGVSEQFRSICVVTVHGTLRKSGVSEQG